MSATGAKKVLSKNRKFSRRLSAEELELVASYLSEQEAKIPKTELQPRHIANCRVILKRIDLISDSSGLVGAEIGVDQGNFTENLLSTGKFKKLFLIDSWGTARFGEDKFANVQKRFAREIESGSVEILRSDSVGAAEKFSDRFFDWIYIDTDHSYATTLNELYAWSPKIKMGGQIAGHDYVKGNWLIGYRYGVVEAVSRFCVDQDWELTALTHDGVENGSFSISKIV